MYVSIIPVLLGEMGVRDRRILEVPGSVTQVYAVAGSKEKRKTPFQNEDSTTKVVSIVSINPHSYIHVNHIKDQIIEDPAVGNWNGLEAIDITNPSTWKDRGRIVCLRPAWST